MGISIKIDSAEALKAADDFRQVSAPELLEVARRTVFEYTDALYDLAAKEAPGKINLGEAYVRSLIARSRSSSQARASLSVLRKAELLTKFPYKQLTQPAKTRRSKGDARLGIPKGQKQAGVFVSISTNTSEAFRYGFLVPLRNQGGRLGLFTKDKSGRLKNRYGPAVYQVVGGFFQREEQSITAGLESAYLKNIDKFFEKVL
jgi:hypothetical protein